jgi:hypothetical protein
MGSTFDLNVLKSGPAAKLNAGKHSTNKIAAIIGLNSGHIITVTKQPSLIGRKLVIQLKSPRQNVSNTFFC